MFAVSEHGFCFSITRCFSFFHVSDGLKCLYGLNDLLKLRLYVIVFDPFYHFSFTKAQ